MHDGTSSTDWTARALRETAVTATSTAPADPVMYHSTMALAWLSGYIAGTRETLETVREGLARGVASVAGEGPETLQERVT